MVSGAVGVGWGGVVKWSGVGLAGADGASRR